MPSTGVPRAITPGSQRAVRSLQSARSVTIAAEPVITTARGVSGSDAPSVTSHTSTSWPVPSAICDHSSSWAGSYKNRLERSALSSWVAALMIRSNSVSMCSSVEIASAIVKTSSSSCCARSSRSTRNACSSALAAWRLIASASERSPSPKSPERLFRI